MKNIGKLFIALGTLNLFRKIDGFHGFGGYVDNTWEILIISLTLTTIGGILLLSNKKLSQMDKFQCPCCDYFTLPERANYDICPICFWEDDGLDLNKSDKTSGPNHGLTIAQARENFSKAGACNKDMVKHVISPNKRDKYNYQKRTF